MNRRGMIVGALSTASIAGCGPPRESNLVFRPYGAGALTEGASMQALLATPERYDGRLIATDGYLADEGEDGLRLYVGREAMGHRLWSQSISFWPPGGPWARDAQRVRRVIGEDFVSATGIFRARLAGQELPLAYGRLEVFRVSRLPSRIEWDAGRPR